MRTGILSLSRAEGRWWIHFIWWWGGRGSVWISVSRKHIHANQHIHFQILSSYHLLQVWTTLFFANFPLKRERMKLYICFLSTDCYVQAGVFFPLFLCGLRTSFKTMASKSETGRHVCINSDSQTGVPSPVASTSPGSLSNMQMLNTLHPVDLLNHNFLWVQHSVLTSSRGILMYGEV